LASDVRLAGYGYEGSMVSLVYSQYATGVFSDPRVRVRYRLPGPVKAAARDAEVP